MTQRFKSSTLRLSFERKVIVGMISNIFPKNNKKQKNLTLQETVDKSLRSEYFKAVDDYKIALQQFNNADPEYIDASITNLNIVKENLNNLLCRIRLNSGIKLHNQPMWVGIGNHRSI